MIIKCTYNKLLLIDEVASCCITTQHNIHDDPNKLPCTQSDLIFRPRQQNEKGVCRKQDKNYGRQELWRTAESKCQQPAILMRKADFEFTCTLYLLLPSVCPRDLRNKAIKQCTSSVSHNWLHRSKSLALIFVFLKIRQTYLCLY